MYKVLYKVLEGRDDHNILSVTQYRILHTLEYKGLCLEFAKSFTGKDKLVMCVILLTVVLYAKWKRATILCRVVSSRALRFLQKSGMMLV